MLTQAEPDVRLPTTEPDPATTIFDLAFYGRQAGRIFNLDDALADYRARGEKAGLQPHPLFKPSHVAEQLRAHGNDGNGVLDAYLRLAGSGIPIDPHPLFDAALYTALAGPFTAGQTPLGHYVEALAAKNSPPTPNLAFDPAYYATQSDGGGLAHYAADGARERRSPHPLFMPHLFLSACGKAGIAYTKDTDALALYLTDRRTWGLPTHTLFQPQDYAAALARAGLPVSADQPPLVQFLAQPADVATHFAFDPDFYRRHAAAIGVKVEEKALLHYLRTKGRSRAAPHPLFSPTYYLANNPDVAGSSLAPLEHFIRHGRFERRGPHPLFTLKPNGPEAEARGERFAQYIATGARTLASPHPLFDAARHAAAYPASLAPGDTPLGHFVKLWSEFGVFCPPWGTALFPRRPGPAALSDPRPGPALSDPRPGPALFDRRPGPAGTSRIDLIVVSHELTRTGAPLILLALVKHFVSRLGLGCLVITQRGGVLLEAFREWAPVIDLTVVREAGVIPGGGAMAAAAQDLFLQQCVAAFEGPDRPRAALVNTACVDSVGKSLAAAGLPVITLIHELAAAFDRHVFETIYETSAAVVYPAAYVRREAHTTFPLPIEKTELLPQGLLDPAFGTRNRAAGRAALLDTLDAPDDAFIVLGCGSLDLRKGIDLFAAVARAAIAAQEASGGPAGARPFFFVWAGGGPTQRHSLAWYIQEDVARAGLAGRIQFIGPRADTEPVFAGSDAFVLTSRLDPFPCVIHEAMACGLPVVAFDNAGGAPEALAGGAGIVVPYGDVAAMAATLVRLAAAPEEATSVGGAAEARVRQEYDFAAYADRVIDCFASRAGVVLRPDTRGPKAGAADSPRRPRTPRGRVVFALPGAQANGEGRASAALMRGLERHGYDTELILTAPGTDAAGLAGLGDAPRRLLTLNSRRPMDQAALAEALVTALGTAAPAILVVGTDAAAAAVAPLLPPRVGTLGIPGDSAAGLQNARQFGWHWQGAVVTSAAARDRLLALVPSLQTRCEIIPPGMVRYPAPAGGPPGDRLRLVCPLASGDTDGAMRPVSALIEALEGQPWQLSVIGNAEQASCLAALFADAVAAGRLRLIAPADETESRAALHAGEILVAVDDLANAPIGLADAMGAGLALIDAAGRTGGSGWHRGTQAAIVVPRGDMRSILRAVAQLDVDRQKLVAARQCAQDTARARSISVEEWHDRYAEWLERMFDELRHGRFVTPAPQMDVLCRGG